MEGSVIGSPYMNLGHSPAALDAMQAIKNNALKFDGEFVLLWHNSHLDTLADKKYYEQMISAHPAASGDASSCKAADRG
jgi:hypothetical protein